MSVVFTRTVPGTYNPATDTFTTPTETTIPGSAIQVRGDPETYRAMSLIQSEAPTLFWTPATYGEYPEPGDTVVWASTTYTVRDVLKIQPDGVCIAVRVIVGT